MENAFLYFVSDYFIIFGIILCLIMNFFTKNKQPLLFYLILITSLLISVFGFLPFFAGAVKLTGLYEIYKNFASVTPFDDYMTPFLASSVLITPLNIFFKFLIGICALGTAFLSYSFIKKLNQKAAHFCTLFLITVLSGNFAAISNDFFSLLISLEILSLSICFMITLFNKKSDKNDTIALEAGVKNYISSILSFATSALGCALIFLHTGSLNFSDINTILINGKLPNTIVLEIGEILFFIGIFGKIGTFPFYNWNLDVFKGANLPTALLISTLIQTAGISAIIKVLTVIATYGGMLNFALILCSILSLLIGNFIAFRTVKKEGSIKTFLCAVCLSNISLVLLGLAFLTKATISAGVFYLAVYLVMNFGIFASFMLIIKNVKKSAETMAATDNLNAIRGLAYISPFFAGAFCACLLSFAGLPFMAGFGAKFYLATEILRNGIWTVYPLIFASFAGAFAIYYNFKLIHYIYSRPNFKKVPYKRISLFNKLNPYTFMVSICAVLLVLGFIFGGYLMNLIEKII